MLLHRIVGREGVGSSTSQEDRIFLSLCTFRHVPTWLLSQPHRACPSISERESRLASSHHLRCVHSVNCEHCTDEDHVNSRIKQRYFCPEYSELFPSNLRSLSKWRFLSLHRNRHIHNLVSVRNFDVLVHLIDLLDDSGSSTSTVFAFTAQHHHLCQEANTLHQLIFPLTRKFTLMEKYSNCSSLWKFDRECQDLCVLLTRASSLSNVCQDSVASS